MRLEISDIGYQHYRRSSVNGIIKPYVLLNASIGIYYSIAYRTEVI